MKTLKVTVQILNNDEYNTSSLRQIEVPLDDVLAVSIANNMVNEAVIEVLSDDNEISDVCIEV